MGEFQKWTFRPKKKKSHVPVLILKFYATAPNLISNFETHKNVGDSFCVYRTYTPPPGVSGVG